MNPREPLAAAADAAPDSELERWKHLFKRASFAGKHDARPHKHDPNRLHACAGGLGLPLAANVRHEPRARRRVFVELFVTAVAVKPHSGAADESGGTRRGRADAVYKMARANHARIAYA